ncbi:MAG: nuclear transport factor 2 family protein [Pseudonocardiaceae bacterium]|nr:nuclear transport factor 2 family protein [Pseudonocardiaceae bacterium]
MSDHPNIALMEKVYASFGSGDVETAGSYWHADSVHHYPGRSPLSGEHVGIKDSTAFANKMWELTNGNLRMEVKEIGASDNHAFAILQTHYERKGLVLDMAFINVALIVDGKIKEFWTYPNDVYAVDEFWNA